MRLQYSFLVIPAAASMAADTAASQREDRLGGAAAGPVELDEFGR